MKIVIKLNDCGSHSSQNLRKFAVAISRLLTEGHQITIVNGAKEYRFNGSSAQVETFKEGLGRNGEKTAATLPNINHNELLVAALGQVGVAAFSLYATDSNIIRIRKKQPAIRNSRDFIIEAAHVDPRWLEILSRNGGVPVIVNIGLGPSQQYWYMDADQMAGRCATDWGADALILVTNADGIRNADGSIVRWLHADKIMHLGQTFDVDKQMLLKLNVCREALERGVRRARLFPFSQIESLALLYFSRIDFGTEVILAAEMQRA